MFHQSTNLLAACLLLLSAQLPTEQSTEQNANQLHSRALALHAHPARYADAASLHIEEAGLRRPADPRAYDCLTLAARLLIYAHRLDDARGLMEQTAQAALARADSSLAAKALVEAAFIAGKQGRRRDARLLIERAKALVDSLPGPLPILSHS